MILEDLHQYLVLSMRLVMSLIMYLEQQFQPLSMLALRLEHRLEIGEIMIEMIIHIKLISTMHVISTK